MGNGRLGKELEDGARRAAEDRGSPIGNLSQIEKEVGLPKGNNKWIWDRDVKENRTPRMSRPREYLGRKAEPVATQAIPHHRRRDWICETHSGETRMETRPTITKQEWGAPM